MLIADSVYSVSSMSSFSSSFASKPTREPVRRPKRLEPATVTTTTTTTPEPTVQPGLEDYAPFIFNNVISEKDLAVLKQCVRNQLKAHSPDADETPIAKRSFNLHHPPKIPPKMNGTSRIRVQLHAYRVLQLCGALIDHMNPADASLKDSNSMSVGDEVREKIRAVQKWSPTQLQLAFERAEFERLRDLANSTRSSTTPAKHNKSSQIRYRSVRNQLIPSERFRKAFAQYHRPPFMLNPRGCRSGLPEKRPPIGKREIWLYPEEEDLSLPPLTRQKKAPKEEKRSRRQIVRPPLKAYTKEPRKRITQEMVHPRRPKRHKRPMVPTKSEVRAEKVARKSIKESLFKKIRLMKRSYVGGEVKTPTTRPIDNPNSIILQRPTITDCTNKTPETSTTIKTEKPEFEVLFDEDTESADASVSTAHSSGSFDF